VVAANAVVGVAGAAAATAAGVAAEVTFEKTVLPSGIRVVTERMPEARSVSTGVWVGVGSRDEPVELAGVSHFLEHLLFKGTAQRSARSIAMAVDAFGGEMNAFTTREHTAYYTRLPSEHLGFGLDLLTEVVSSPAFRPHEVDSEREVILEEILMNEDAPDDVVVTALYDAVFPDHPVGRETLGSRGTVSEMSRESIAGFHALKYRPVNLVVAAAGDLEHARVVDAVGSFLAEVPPGDRPHREPPAAEPVPFVLLDRPTEQAHVAIGWRSLHHDDPDRYALSIANHALGGGMSSRLFHEIREERGLAYTVYTSPAAYYDCGAVSLYAGTSPSRLGELMEIIDRVIETTVDQGLTDEELRVALGYLEGSLVLGLEDSGSRMGRMGTSEITRGEVIPVEEHLRRLRAVTGDDVHRVLRRVFGGSRSVAVVGPFTGDEAELAMISDPSGAVPAQPAGS
jgi:predicted Zn-dependent peptidase